MFLTCMEMYGSKEISIFWEGKWKFWFEEG
jgi:hypothetical protein